MKNIDPAYAEQLVTSQMGANISESKQAGIPTIQQRIAVDESVHLPR
jgi:hypothetical protein